MHRAWLRSTGPSHLSIRGLGNLVTWLVLEREVRSGRKVPWGAAGAAGAAATGARVRAGRQGLPVTARLHLLGHARVTPDALEVPCSNFNFIVSQSFSGSS